MGFNEAQDNEICEFLLRYNSDEDYRAEVEELYFNNPSGLSILQIYALEEILRFGNNGIYESFLEMNGSDERPVEQLAGFLKLCREDEIFKEYKLKQLEDFPDMLSEVEVFALNLLIRAKTEPEKLHKELTDQLEYDPLTPIRYENDDRIRETLTDLLFGQFIHQLLELPEMAPIKVRQRQSGMIANIDKAHVINMVQRAIPGSLETTVQVVDKMYLPVKFNLLLGNGVEAFREYLPFHTNVSAREIFALQDQYGNKER